jgi:cysteine synthase A
VHRETTGVEIYQDLDGQVDQLVAGAGTGGTFSGVLEYLKSKNPQILGILADPIGSTMGGGTGASYLIEGIGNCFMPSTMNMAIVDEVYKISDAEAFAAARLLAVREGILAGSSSGAVLAAAKKFAQKGATGNMVVILADRGDRYLSKDLYSQ